jgi:hypothetical protein
MRLLDSRLLLLLIALMLSFSLRAQERPPTLLLEVDPNNVLQDGPIVATLVIRSESKSLTNLDLGDDGTSNLTFYLTHNSDPLKSLHLPVPSFASLGVVSLKSGQTLRKRLVLNSILSSSHPGVYGVSVRMAWDTSMTLASNEILISISPKTDRDLADACQSILLRIVGAPDAQSRKDATRELTAVSDPLAIPYLISAVDADPGNADVLVGRLLEFGTPASVEGLSKVIHGKDAELVSYTRSGLKRLAASSGDEGVQRRARELSLEGLTPADR